MVLNVDTKHFGVRISSTPNYKSFVKHCLSPRGEVQPTKKNPPPQLFPEACHYIGY